MYNYSVDLMWLVYTTLFFYLAPGIVAGAIWFWPKKQNRFKSLNGSV